jgi:short-subunit dehydrogenase
MEKLIALGASRGLGATVVKKLQNKFEVIALSRKSEKHKFDFSKNDEQLKVLEFIRHKRPQRIFYFAGGGPFGRFADKEWKDHQWALEVNFLFPSRLLHYVLANPGNVKQLVFVGSLIAENKAHPMGASYGAGKSALRALIDSTVNETKNSIDIRLFSPGYMDTEMLPKNAYPRREGMKLLSPDFVAEKFCEWVNNTNANWYLGVPNE